MLSDEEKKAIKIMKEVKAKNVHTFVNELSILLNLIEKQSKEIEELKQIIKENTILVKDENGDYQELNIDIEDFINKDKIKVKIEELERDKNKLYKEQGNIEEIKIYSVIDIIKAEILRFKELLEKE